MRLGEHCERRAAGGEAAAANVSEHGLIARTASRRARATFCRAGFAGRGMAPAGPNQRPTLASRPDPRRSLGSDCSLGSD